MKNEASDIHEVMYEESASAPEESRAHDPLLLLHRKLRGKYRIVVLLAIVFALCGGMIGYKATVPTYESKGLIRVIPSLPAILYSNEETQPLPQFDSFVAAQATFVQSREVLDQALRMDVMKKAGWPQDARGIALLQDALKVTSRRGEQLITVSVICAQPRMAQAAVNAVLSSYEQSYGQQNKATLDTRELTLEERVKTLEGRYGEIQREIFAATKQYGADAIAQMHDRKIEQLGAIDERLGELKLAIEALQTIGDQPHADEIARQLGLDPILDTPGTGTDRELLALERDKLTIEAEIKSYRERYGSRAPIILELERRLNAVQYEIDAHIKAVASLEGRDISPEDRRAAITDAKLKALNELLLRYRAMYETASDDAYELGAMRETIKILLARKSMVNQQIEETRRRLDQLRVESKNLRAARVKIVAAGDLPVKPNRDKRTNMAAAGSLFGASMGPGLMLLISLVWPRIRFVADLVLIADGIPVIQLLPKPFAENPACRRLASNAVHQLRNILQLQALERDDQVYTVTSGAAREGKTRLILELGTSFAATDRKTLIIDADFDGQGTTREFALTERPGLAQIIGAARGAGKVYQSPTKNLWIMPVGEMEGFDPERLSHDKLSWLMDALRARFDTILIDTGTILKSLEATLAASVSDRVVLVVSRQQRTSVVKASLSRLELIDADIASFVFSDRLKNPAEEGPLNELAPALSPAQVRGRQREESARPMALAGVMGTGEQMGSEVRSLAS